MDIITVGVDGSMGAASALEFAVEEAQRRDGTVRVVCVWEPPLLVKPEVVENPGVFSIQVEQAEAIVAEAVARARELRPDTSCEGEVLGGDPGKVLVEDGHNVSLIVVGRRGQRGLVGLILGSVSRYVADNAPCPVTIVPPRARA